MRFTFDVPDDAMDGIIESVGQLENWKPTINGVANPVSGPQMCAAHVMSYLSNVWREYNANKIRQESQQQVQAALVAVEERIQTVKSQTAVIIE